MTEPDVGWPIGPSRPTLRLGEVHIWRVGLALSDADRVRVAGLLSVEELERADRFRFDVHRHRFQTARGALRDILARYLAATDPRDLVFETAEHGKPRLVQSGEAAGISFNSADSADLALIAVTRAAEVGVDLEKIVPERAGEKLAERFFSAAEAETLASLSPDVRIQGFFNCWTRKEAYLKAVGTGLLAPLDSFAVSLVPGEPPRLLFVDGDPAAPDRWSLAALHAAPGYAAAVAIEQTDWQISCWSWAGLMRPPL